MWFEPYEVSPCPWGHEGEDKLAGVRCSRPGCEFRHVALSYDAWEAVSKRVRELQDQYAALEAEARRLNTALDDIVRRGNCSGAGWDTGKCGECSWCIAHQALEAGK